MTIEEWRRRIDEIDPQIVDLINQRAEAAREIGKLKNATSLPIYEPDRENTILANVERANRGPLPASEIQHIFRSIIGVMREFQRQEIHRSGQ